MPLPFDAVPRGDVASGSRYPRLVLRAFGGKPRHGVAILGILVGQALDYPAQLLARQGLLGLGGGG